MHKILLLSLLFSVSASGQSLDILVEQYLKNSPEISQLKSKINEASARHKEAKRAMLPSITLNGQARKQEQPTLIPFVTPPDKSYSVFAELYQPIYLGGKISAGLKSRGIQYDLSKKQYKENKSRLIISFISDLLDYKLSKEQYSILKSSEKTAKQFLSTTRNRHKRGGARDYELNQAQSQFYSYGPRLLNSKISINNLKTKIIVNTGLASIDSLVWDWEATPSIGPLLSAPGLSQVKESRSDYKSLVAQKKIAQQSVKIDMSEFKPQVNITGQFGYQTNSSRDLFEDRYESQNLALNVSVPLFSGFRRSAVKQAGQSNLMSIDARLKQYENTLESDLKQSLETLISSEKNLKNTKDWRLRSKKALDSARKDFKKGLISQNEIVQLQSAYEVAAFGYMGSLKTFYLAKMNREFILGLNLSEIYSKR